MRVTLYKYFTREICTIFFVSIFIFAFIIMATNIMNVMELLINQRVYASQIITIFLCLIPRVILFSMPAACLLCVLLTFLRLSSDNEIIALHSSGVSLYQMLPPVILFSFLSFIVAITLALYAVPLGNRAYKNVFIQIVKSKADMTIKERVFFEPFNDVIFYVNQYSQRDKIMKNLFVVDKRGFPTTNTIVAKKGKILSNQPAEMVTILFTDGTIFTVDQDYKTARTIKFDTYTLNIDIENIIASITSRKKRPAEMSISELIQARKTLEKKDALFNQVEVKLYEMFSIPLAIFFMGIIGVPLGAHVRASGRTKGIMISLSVFLIYYILMMSAKYLLEIESLTPSVGVWIPNLFLLIACVYLLIRVAKDRPVKLLEKLSLKPIKKTS